MGSGQLVVFLADSVNGRAHATVLRPSVVVYRKSATLCIVAKIQQKSFLGGAGGSIRWG